MVVYLHVLENTAITLLIGSHPGSCVCFLMYRDTLQASSCACEPLFLVRPHILCREGKLLASNHILLRMPKGQLHQIAIAENPNKEMPCISLPDLHPKYLHT